MYIYLSVPEHVDCCRPCEKTDLELTTFTECSGDSGLVRHRDKRPALLVSSTSWTGQCLVQ